MLGQLRDINPFGLFSPDSNQIITCYEHGSVLIHTLLTREEKDILELQNLNSYQLLLIDKVLDGEQDIPLADYKISGDIIKLLKKL